MIGSGAVGERGECIEGLGTVKVEYAKEKRNSVE